MSSNGSPTYELQQMPGVALSVKNLASLAIAKGIKQEYLTALRHMVAKLQEEPAR